MYLHTYTYYASRVKSMFVEIFFLPARARIDVTKRWHNTSPPPRSLIHPLLSVVQRLPLEYRSDSCLWIIDARPYMYIILCTFKFSSLFGVFFFFYTLFRRTSRRHATRRTRRRFQAGRLVLDADHGRVRPFLQMMLNHPGRCSYSRAG